MTAQSKFWILAACFFSALVVWTWFGLLSVRTAARQTDDDIHKIERSIERSFAEIRMIPDVQRDRQRVEWRVRNLRNRVLAIDSISPAMTQLNELAQQFQMRLRTIDFSTDTLLSLSRLYAGSSESFELPLLLEIEGRYLDFGLFVEGLPKLPFAIVVTDFRMQASGRKNTLIIEARAKVRIRAPNAITEL